MTSSQSLSECQSLSLASNASWRLRKPRLILRSEKTLVRAHYRFTAVCPQKETGTFTDTDTNTANRLLHVLSALDLAEPSRTSMYNQTLLL